MYAPAFVTALTATLFVAVTQVKVKPLASVKGSDRALYKLVDLAEITNPGTSCPLPHPFLI
jgi:hypothetical protein